jgi:hypothetical protein
MLSSHSASLDDLSDVDRQRIMEHCGRFTAAWHAYPSGPRPDLETFLNSSSGPGRRVLVKLLLPIEIRRRFGLGEAPAATDYLALLPHDAGLIHQVIAETGTPQIDSTVTQTGSTAPRPGGSEQLADYSLSENASLYTNNELTSTRDTQWIPLASQSASGESLPEIPGYIILRKLGQGGMGQVVLARHLQLGRLVAVKLPLQVLSGHAAERFLREARAAAVLRHPHICPLYEVGDHEGRPFLVMGYIEGPTLRDWAKQMPTARRSAELVAVLAKAAAHAHAKGIVHRDIKPTNVRGDNLV